MSEHTFPSTGTTRSDPMNSTFLRTAGALLLALAPALAFGDAPVPDKGDTSWMMISTVLVILMTIPGLALFYGGMVRSKNVLSVLMQVFMVFCLVTVLWVVFGYSLAFTTGNAFFGSLDKMFLNGVNAGTLAATFSKGVYIPEYVYVAFQGTFAAITPCLIVGAFADIHPAVFQQHQLSRLDLHAIQPIAFQRYRHTQKFGQASRHRRQ